MNISEFQEINSLENKQIKILKKLSSKKYREELGLFSVENFVIIIDALKDSYDFEALFVTEAFANKHEESLKKLLRQSKSNNLYLINDKVNKFYSELETPSGVTAIYKIKEQSLTKGSVVYLNAISDPGNMGTIMRSALAFDFVNFVLDEKCVDVYNSKTISAAKDAIFKLNISFDNNFEFFKKTKLPVYSANAVNGGDLKKFKAAKDFCVVLGSESHGIDKKIIDISEANLNIKISSKIESLNVASAAAIIFYELKK